LAVRFIKREDAKLEIEKARNRIGCEIPQIPKGTESTKCSVETKHKAANIEISPKTIPPEISKITVRARTRQTLVKPVM
jgi:hypothetical protein